MYHYLLVKNKNNMPEKEMQLTLYQSLEESENPIFKDYLFLLINPPMFTLAPRLNLPKSKSVTYLPLLSSINGSISCGKTILQIER